MIVRLVGAWTRSGVLSDFEYEEILSTAYLQAERILRTRFDPDRGTAATYLSRYLFGFVHYWLLRQAGKRKTRTGWIEEKRRDPPARQREIDPADQIELEDLISALHPDLRDLARRLSLGDSLEEIVAEEGFDTRVDAPKSPEARVEELRRLLAGQILRLR